MTELNVTEPDVLDEIHKFRTFNKLKFVIRSCNRESSADHTWGCLMLADFLFDNFDLQVDENHVKNILLYHDVVEIESGDTHFHPNVSSEGKEDLEDRSAKILATKLPLTNSQKFLKLFLEFEQKKTREARLAKAIDTLEALIYFMDLKEEWKGWTEEFLRAKKGPLFEEFPELKKMFEATVIWCRENGFFDQK